jgi:hypothetical protein
VGDKCALLLEKSSKMWWGPGYVIVKLRAGRRVRRCSEWEWVMRSNGTGYSMLGRMLFLPTMVTRHWFSCHLSDSCSRFGRRLEVTIENRAEVV